MSIYDDTTKKEKKVSGIYCDSLEFPLIHWIVIKLLRASIRKLKTKEITAPIRLEFWIKSQIPRPIKKKDPIKIRRIPNSWAISLVLSIRQSIGYSPAAVKVG